MIHSSRLTIKEFASFLNEHVQGDWWDNIPQLTPNPEWGQCESCQYHPLTQEVADILNGILNGIREAGGPSPTWCYPHCGGNAFIEWHGENGTSVCMDVFNRFGRDALLFRRDRVPLFVKVD